MSQGEFFQQKTSSLVLVVFKPVSFGSPHEGINGEKKYDVTYFGILEITGFARSLDRTGCFSGPKISALVQICGEILALVFFPNPNSKFFDPKSPWPDIRLT